MFFCSADGFNLLNTTGKKVTMGCSATEGTISRVLMACSVTQGTIRIVIMACSATEGTFSRVIMACSVTQGTIHIVIMVCSVTERQNHTFFLGGRRYDEPRVALVETGHALSQREDLEWIARPEGARPKAGAD